MTKLRRHVDRLVLAEERELFEKGIIPNFQENPKLYIDFATFMDVKLDITEKRLKYVDYIKNNDDLSEIPAENLIRFLKEELKDRKKYVHLSTGRIYEVNEIKH